MTSARQPIAQRVLLVDDNQAVRAMTALALELKGFELVAVVNLSEALRYIVTENFDVLITNLNVPNASDGLAVVTAMRRSQPNAVILLLSDFTDLQSAKAERVVLQADEVIVKPFEIGHLTDLVQERVIHLTSIARLDKQRVGEVLHRCINNIVKDWLDRVKQSAGLNSLCLSDGERTGHLPELVEDLAIRLNRSHTSDSRDVIFSHAAVTHGELRYRQGYTPAMLVHESRILQLTVFGSLQSELDSLKFGLQLPDIVAIADEVDAQLTQAIESFMRLMWKSMAA